MTYRLVTTVSWAFQLASLELAKLVIMLSYLLPPLYNARYVWASSRSCKVVLVSQKDVMPYAIFGGNPPAYRGVNTKVIEYFHPTVSDRVLRHLANAFRLVTAGNFSLEDAVDVKIHEQIEMSDEIKNSQPGLHRLSFSRPHPLTWKTNSNFHMLDVPAGCSCIH